MVKVGCLHSFPNEKSNYAKFTNTVSPTYKVLAAPEDLEAARSGKVACPDTDSSEMFSIGTTVMGAGLLNDMSSIYNYPSR